MAIRSVVEEKKITMRAQRPERRGGTCLSAIRDYALEFARARCDIDSATLNITFL